MKRQVLQTLTSSPSGSDGEENESHDQDFVSPQTSEDELDSSDEFAFALDGTVLDNSRRCRSDVSRRNGQRPGIGIRYYFGMSGRRHIDASRGSRRSPMGSGDLGHDDGAKLWVRDEKYRSSA